MNLQRRDEEQNDEGAQEHGAYGAHGMCAPPPGDSRESRHGGDDLFARQSMRPFRVMRRVVATCDYGTAAAAAGPPVPPVQLSTRK